MGKNAIVCIVKIEERDIAEWLAYHFSLGFDSVIVYDNCSADNTRDVILKFTRDYDTRLVLWEQADRLYQIDAYTHAFTRFRSQFEWGLVIDTDEFLVGYDREFLDNFDDSVGQILLNWLMFGTSGHESFPSGLVIENCLYRAPGPEGVNRHTKPFVRFADFVNCGNPHHCGVRGRSVDIDGSDIVWSDSPGPGVIAAAAKHHGPRIHHYHTKSKADWIRKNSSRGYHDRPPRQIEEFEAYDRMSTIRDESALAHAPRVREILDKLGLGEFSGPAQRTRDKSAVIGRLGKTYCHQGYLDPRGSVHLRPSL